VEKDYEEKRLEISNELKSIYYAENKGLSPFIEIGEWLMEQGYFHINSEMFGKTLAGITSKKLGIDYKYQEKPICYKTPEYYGCKRFDKHYKFISVLSPVEYGEFYKEKTFQYSFRKKDDFDTVFKKNPVNLREDEIILYSDIKFFPEETQLVWFFYGNDSDHTFHLNDFSFFPEIKHQNEKYGFIHEFVIAILDYKLKNKKPKLNDTDMEIILKNLGINRDEENQRLIDVLRNIRDNAINTLISNNQVGKTLKREYSISVTNKE